MNLPSKSRSMWRTQDLFQELRFVRLFLTFAILWICSQIPQLYIHHPTDAGEPPSILKGFNNVEVDPGQTEQITITLSRYDLSIWDVAAQGWRKPTGTIKLSVGASSRDLRLRGVIPK